MSVTLRVPATVANLGAGFDALGVAVRLHLEVEAEPGERLAVHLEGEGAAELPTDETNLVVVAMAHFAEVVGRPMPPCTLRLRSAIPLASGLGSSAAAVVAGLLVAQALTGARLPPSDLLRLAAEVDGHADNVAPALFGGFVISYRSGDEWRWLRLEPSRRLAPILAVPRHGFSTTEARHALPRTVTLADAQFTAARAALASAVLLLGETGPALSDALDDRLHQPHRLGLMPGTAALHGELRAAGVPAVLAGSGPSLLLVVPTGELPRRMAQVRRLCDRLDGGWRILVPGWEPVGATTPTVPAPGIPDGAPSGDGPGAPSG